MKFGSHEVIIEFPLSAFEKKNLFAIIWFYLKLSQ